MMRTLRFLPCSLLFLPAAAVPVQVGLLPAKIVPEQVATIPMEAGVISNLADAALHHERGEVIARLNEERTEQEREELELKLAREAVTHKDELRKLEAQRAKVVFYLGLSESERRYATDIKLEDAAPTKASLADIDERIGLLKRELESAPRIRRNEFERAHARNTVKMPFSGRLQYHFTLPAESGGSFEYTPAPGQPFASVCDDSAFYITINLSRAELTQLPPENFTVTVALPAGRELKGTYDHRRVEQANGGDMLVYFFRLPQEQHETAYKMLGSHAQTKLMYEAGEGAVSVSKLELARRPEAAQCENWEQLIERLYPDHSILLIGERDIILQQR